MPVGDLVAIPACIERLGKEFVEILSNGTNLLCIQHVNGRDIALLVVVVYLFVGQQHRVFHAEREEAQVAIQFGVSVDNLFHDRSPAGWRTGLVSQPFHKKSHPKVILSFSISPYSMDERYSHKPIWLFCHSPSVDRKPAILAGL